MVKRKGDRGFPYLNPLVALTHPLVLSFTKITKFLIDEHSLIQVLHLGLNRFLSSTWSKINFEDYRRQSTWSYSFSKSILKTNSSSLERLFSSTISFAINNVSKIYLPWTKAPWETWIVSWRTPCISPDRTLVIILYRQVVKLIDLKSKISLVWLFFDISAMKVALVLRFITFVGEYGQPVGRLSN